VYARTTPFFIRRRFATGDALTTVIHNAAIVTVDDARAVLGNAESVVRPRWLPYPNTNVRLYGATYSIKLHPVPAGP